MALYYVDSPRCSPTRLSTRPASSRTHLRISQTSNQSAGKYTPRQHSRTNPQTPRPASETPPSHALALSNYQIAPPPTTINPYTPHRTPRAPQKQITHKKTQNSRTLNKRGNRQKPRNIPPSQILPLNTQKTLSILQLFLGTVGHSISLISRFQHNLSPSTATPTQDTKTTPTRQTQKHTTNHTTYGLHNRTPHRRSTQARRLPHPPRQTAPSNTTRDNHVQ